MSALGVLRAIALSGRVLALTLLPLADGRDDRDSHWMMIATLVAAIVVPTRRYRAAVRSSERSVDRAHVGGGVLRRADEERPLGHERVLAHERE
jgi:hypothetical protein